MQEGISHVLNYFNVFSYPPDFTEIHMFLPFTTSKEKLQSELKHMEHARKLVSRDNRYTQSVHVEFFDIYEKRSAISKVKKDKMRGYIKTLVKYTGIKAVALTGSISMLNADSDGDVDLFIIAKNNRIWTTRLIALLIAQAYGIRRKYDDKKFSSSVCLNLFFDEQYLEIPDVKKNEYVGHELLQMKKIYDNDCTFNRLILSNQWVFDLFPNAREYIDITNPSTNNQNHWLFSPVGAGVELLARCVQLLTIRRHTTTEKISDKQLWFFPDDFQKKLEKKISITTV
jgi:predicted nucleotidyltransferase